MNGKTVSHYRILEKLGGGGMGVVYRARDERLDRDVALKFLLGGILADDTARSRFRREALILSQLNHTNIAVVYDFDSENGVDFLAMEYVTGETLAAKVAGGPLPEKQVIALGTQIAEALEEAHEHDVIHRDLKPGNVMVTTKGRVKVLDFGLAKLLKPAEVDATTASLAKTQAGAIMGTVPYMAPEQLQGKAVDGRADIYALGALLYEMATGRRPFPEKQASQLIAAILAQAPQQPRELNGQVSLGLEAIILKSLEKSPEQRYQSAKEVLASLRGLALTGSVAATRRRVPAQGWGLAGLVAASLVVLLATLVGLNVGGLRQRLLSHAGPPRIESLAVLPLENLSGDPQQEYFADGMTEALITDLARLTGLKRVIARGSVMRYKGTNKSLAEIARALKVDALITGAVVRSGNRLGLTAQLVNPETEEQIWAQRYERDQRDVLRLQSELTLAIASEIRVKFAPEEKTRVEGARAVNPEAHDAYLQGRFHWQKISPKELATAEQYFQLALEKDPGYALPYTGLGIVWGQRCLNGVVPCREAAVKWKEAVRKALELEPSSPEAKAQAAGLKFYVDWDWAAAGNELQRAIEREPNYPEAHLWYAQWLCALAGRTQQGLAEFRRAVELDPYNSLFKALVGQALLYEHRDNEAIAYLQQLVQVDPNTPRARGLLQGAFERKQMYEEAMAQWRLTLATGGDREIAAEVERGYAQGGYRGAERARAELAVQRSHRTYIRPTEIAGFYAGAGEKELALDWLEKGYQEHESQMVLLKVLPRWDILRDHPRFQTLLRRMNFPPEGAVTSGMQQPRGLN